MYNVLKKIGLITVLLLVLDATFISSNMKMFKRQIQNVQHSGLSLNIYGAIPCYILMIFGLYYFIIREHRSIMDAVLLGFLVFGVYDTTNYSTFKNWSLITVIIDTLWGGFLFGFTTYIVYLIYGSK